MNELPYYCVTIVNVKIVKNIKFGGSYNNIVSNKQKLNIIIYIGMIITYIHLNNLLKCNLICYHCGFLDSLSTHQKVCIYNILIH